DRPGKASQPRDHEEYQAKPVLRLCVQCSGDPDCCGCPLPDVRPVAEPDDRQRGDGDEFGYSYRKCASATDRAALTVGFRLGVWPIALTTPALITTPRAPL